MSGSPAPIGVVAHYNLLEQLEPSGPGDLYRARDTKAGRTVAVRLLPADFTSDPAALINQARGLTALSHPNVTTLFDVGEHEGRVYFAFEFQKGQSLRAETAGRPMNVRRAVEIAIQIADAVADAHAAGFVHGGLSPESIVISAKGRAKIPAFELAAQGGFEHDGREARLHDYESPEEANGQAAPDDRSDIYSVGAILYEMLTTRRPMHRGASAPSASNPKVPKEIDAVVLKALAPNPANRYQNAVGLAGELRASIAVLDQLGVAGEEEELALASSTSVGRVVVMAAIMLVVAVLAWWFLR
jgi:eukaryotic-like serine/threonine-protein kinase